MKCAVLGSPIKHSLSPVLHRAAYRELGLSGWQYERHEVDEAGLARFVEQCGEEWVGLSLTMPLKHAALDLGVPTEAARVVGAANTLVLDHQQRRHPLHNTDITGMTTALRGAGLGQADTALLVGAGASARSALAALAPLGVRHVQVMARSAARAHASLDPVAGHFGQHVRVIDWDGAPAHDVDLTVATAPAALSEACAEAVAAVSPILFDIIYDPWPTVLASAAHRAGRTVLDGIDLLAHQAVDQVALMTGHAVDARVLLAAGRAALDPEAAGSQDLSGGRAHQRAEESK